MTAMKLPYILLEPHGRPFFLLSTPTGLVVGISYYAIRGKYKEHCAVQRVLNSRRSSKIRDFALAGGEFLDSIVMNWVEEGGLKYDTDSSTFLFHPKPRLAHLIDGQHRVAGLAEPMEANEDSRSIERPVAICSGLPPKSAQTSS